MLAHHLLSGIVIGALVALASLLQGFSLGAASGFCALGANIGVVASVLGALSARMHNTSKLASAAQWLPKRASSFLRQGSAGHATPKVSATS